MKKIIAFLLCFMLVSCSPKISFKEENYQKISYSEVETKIQNKESFTFYLGQKGCPTCEKYEKNLMKYFAKNPNKKIYYLSYEDNFAKDKPYYGKEKELLKVANDILGDDYYEMMGMDKTQLYTPTTYKVSGGKYTSVLIGDLGYDNIDSMLNYPNYIMEEVNYLEFINKLESPSNEILYLGQEGCPGCASFIDKLNHYQSDKKITLFYLDAKLIARDEEAMKTLKGYVFMGNNNPLYLEHLYTPTIFIKRDGKMSAYVENIPLDELFK